MAIDAYSTPAPAAPPARKPPRCLSYSAEPLHPAGAQSPGIVDPYSRREKTARGALGATLIIIKFDDAGNATEAAAGHVGPGGLKANTDYSLQGGKLVEVAHV